MNYSKTTVIVFILLVCSSEFVYAPPPPPGLPIDGGIGFLTLSGIIYGVYASFKKN